MGAFAPREISYADEATYCEGEVSGFWTWSKRLPALDARPDFVQDRQSDGSLQTRQNESRPGYLLAKRGSLELDFLWHGHGTDPTGALVETWLQALLAHGLGGGDVTEVGGTVGVGSTTTSLVYAAATLVRGGIIRVGQRGDGGGDGEATVVGTPTASPATLLTALPAAPSNGHVIRAAQIAYPKETLVTTKRFLYAHTVHANSQWVALGCQLAGLTLKSVFGSPPMWTFRYLMGYFGGPAPIVGSVPQVATLEDCKAAPMAGATCYYQTVGTATRNLLVPSEVELSLDLGLAEKKGAGAGAAPHRDIAGYERTRCVPTLKLRCPWSDEFATLYDTDGSGTTHKHILVMLNAQAGRSVGFYMPRAYPVGPRPSIDEYNELGYVTVMFRGREGTDTTNELTRSPVRFFSA